MFIPGEKTKDSDNGAPKAETRTDSGFQYYPERRGGKMQESLLKVAVLGEGRDSVDHFWCERNVQKCFENSPLVKLMLSALKSAGCEVNIRRNVCCEPCDKAVTGGYDPELNQVVVCQNSARRRGMVQGILAHELLHMFDQCRAKMDLKNIDHLACTEIRAANLFHCSFMSAFLEGSASPFNIAKTHGECVKRKAVQSVIAVRGITEEKARAAVDKVFAKCYNDLEPVGRRLRRNSLDMERAYRERYHYGYCE